MKNKAGISKIDALSHGIKAIKSKAENAKNLQDSGIFQTLESDLEALLVLQKDVQKNKDLLKTKVQELEERIAKLKLASREVRKDLKKEKKAPKPLKKEKTRAEIPPAPGKGEGKVIKGKSSQKTK